MLKIKQLETGYGKKQVLFNLSMLVHEGEIVAIIGPNGAGKSTILKAICGVIPIWKGEISFNGSPINNSTPAENVARGITYGPQGSRVFQGLTVIENLEIGGYRMPFKETKKRIEQVLEDFPILKGRASQDAGQLSGGEQQMLALARALIPQPKLLMLDEPSLGLSPNFVGEVFRKITEINRETGIGILIVEQKVREVLNICDKVLSIRLGKVAYDGPPDELKNDKDELKRLFL